MQPSTLLVCKNCGNHFTGKYCNECGEKVYTEHDRTVVHFFEEGLHFLTHFEGTFFTTVKTTFLRPGKVSVDYTAGIRKKYFKLVSLFLLLVIIYLLFPAFEGLNMKLYYHMHHAMYGDYAQQRVEMIMQTQHLSEDQISKMFHAASEKTSKVLLVILIPLTALATWPVTFKKRKYAFDQLVFATETNCFFLMWGFLILPLLVLLFALLYNAITGRYVDLTDNITGPLIVAPLFVFVAIASRRFYKLRKWQSLFFGLYFLLLHTFIVQYLYKFILFATVINQIH